MMADNLTPDYLVNLPMHCVICTRPLPEDRIAKGAITCRPAEKDCAKIHKMARRARRDMRSCRHCYRPSTPEQRADFKRWMRERGMVKRGRPAKKEKKQHAKV